MRLHVKLKEFLSMFFMAILFFPAFNASLFFTGVKPLYSIIKCSTLIGREELQHARDAVTSAQAQLDVAIQQYNANQAMILGTKLEDQPAVQQAATEVRNAWLALERTRIVSPMTGYVSRRAVQPGAQISPTTPLMAVVPATNMWDRTLRR